MAEYSFCTYFDRNYLFKGLALHRSLLRHCPSFRLWVLCCDAVTFDLLSALRLPSVELIRMEEFEDAELRAVKSSRTPTEYLWTLTPSLPLFLLGRYPALPHIGYLDADLFFFHTPQPVYDEWGDNASLVIGHRFPPDQRYKEKTNGIYNVSMQLFRNDADGRAVLTWWRDQCLRECSYRDGGTCGDQKYLDEWPRRFPRVRVLQHKGANLAPWNIDAFAKRIEGGCVWIQGDPLVFYHFHQFRPVSPHVFDFGAYAFTDAEVGAIYHPYIAAIQESIQTVRRLRPGFRAGLLRGAVWDWLWKMRGSVTSSPHCYYQRRVEPIETRDGCPICGS
jgi:hypothetical protein